MNNNIFSCLLALFYPPFLKLILLAYAALAVMVAAMFAVVQLGLYVGMPLGGAWIMAIALLLCGVELSHQLEEREKKRGGK